jgi:hypothetical protein
MFELPPKDIFPDSTVRYPNLWILVSEKHAANYRQALQFVVDRLEESTEMVNDYGYFHTAEGCDAFARRRGLAYVELGEHGEWSHDHELHLRFYTHALKQQPPVKVDKLQYYSIAISIHFEVDRPAHLHPYVDDCPMCGCTGAYAKYYEEAFHNRASNTKNEYMHDPLGLEVVLYGTVQGGQRVPLIQGLDIFQSRYEIHIEQRESSREDINTAKLGLVYFKFSR